MRQLSAHFYFFVQSHPSDPLNYKTRGNPFPAIFPWQPIFRTFLFFVQSHPSTTKHAAIHFLPFSRGNPFLPLSTWLPRRITRGNPFPAIFTRQPIFAFFCHCLPGYLYAQSFSMTSRCLW